MHVISMPTRRSHYHASLLPGDFHRPTLRSELILFLLREYRLMRTTHLIEFLKYFNEATSEQRTIRTLRWLFDNLEVLRIRNDPDSHLVAQGSLPKIYGLYTAANLALNERRDRASRVIPHALEICNTVSLGIVRACRESNGQLRFVDAPAILESMGTAQAKAMATPFTWPVEVTYRGHMRHYSLTPDRFFCTLASATLDASYFALEEDRSSIPNQRSLYSLSGSSMFRKLLFYIFLYYFRVLEQLYGIKGFRILVVTDSDTRIENLRAMWKRANEVLMEFQKQSGLEVHAVGNNVLLCVTRSTLRPGTIFSVPWVNGRGDEVMLDSPLTAPLLSSMG
jgi:hypothetical protein